MPFLPFARPYIDEETIKQVADVLRSGWIASGPKVLTFEAGLSEYFSGRPVRVFTSATAALEVALQVCGIGAGDEVITPAQGFFATANMILKVGAKPVFVDVDLDTRNMDLAQARSAITSKTKALMPVHFAGLPLDMEELYQPAAKHSLRVIEDAALAMGASWRGRRIGSFGDIAAFSFHPNKNMTTIEGGALAFENAAEAKLAEKLRFHGIVRLPDASRDVDFPGGKFNLSDVSAAIGSNQLRLLDTWNSKRRELAQHYLVRLETDPPCRLPAPGGEGHCWSMFCVLLPLDQISVTRKQFIDQMQQQGIGIGISYEAIHLVTLYRRLGYQPGDFPNAERIGRETVTLPLFPEMTLADVERVCETMKRVLRRAKR